MPQRRREPEQIPTTPDVLRWARETRGYSLQQAAQVLGVSRGALVEAETVAQSISSKLFSKMVVAYKQTKSVLLMPTAPDYDPLPRHFRTDRGQSASLTLDTRLAIREARRFQRGMSELADDEHELIPHANIPQADIGDSPETHAVSERQHFNISMSAQRSWKASTADDESFRKWRARAQELGVFVLVKRMPWNDVRGMSLWEDDQVPVVVVNSRDTTTAKVFTLFHEYAHLMLRESAGCLLKGKHTGARDRIERWCNAFAASFLMPRRDVEDAVERLKPPLASSEWELRHVQRLARQFKVSRVAMAIRLKELDVTNFYDKHKEQLFAFDKRSDPKRGAGSIIVIPHVMRLVELGSGAAAIVLDALKGATIDSFEASELLDLSPDQMRELEKNVGRQRIRDAPA